MKYCNRCKVEVIGNLTFCPLCQSELLVKGEIKESIFPPIEEVYIKQHLILKIVGFISIIASILSIFFNLMIPSTTFWALIVILTVGSVWMSLATAIKKHRNILKYLLYQSVIICLFAIFLDMITGWRGWALTFVLPIVFTLAMVVMYLLTKILHLKVGDYMIYLLLDALFGIIPIIFLITNCLRTDIPSIVCILTSMISVTGLIVFEGKNMLSELKRRLHV